MRIDMVLDNYKTDKLINRTLLNKLRSELNKTPRKILINNWLNLYNASKELTDICLFLSNEYSILQKSERFYGKLCLEFLISTHTTKVISKKLNTLSKVNNLLNESICTKSEYIRKKEIVFDSLRVLNSIGNIYDFYPCIAKAIYRGNHNTEEEREHITENVNKKYKTNYSCKFPIIKAHYNNKLKELVTKLKRSLYKSNFLECEIYSKHIKKVLKEYYSFPDRYREEKIKMFPDRPLDLKKSNIEKKIKFYETKLSPINNTPYSNLLFLVEDIKLKSDKTYQSIMKDLDEINDKIEDYYLCKSYVSVERLYLYLKEIVREINTLSKICTDAISDTQDYLIGWI